MLVAQGAAGIRARALTHSTAKWDWLRERADGRHVLRLSYDDEPASLESVALADASALLGVALPAPIDFARVEWTRSVEGSADVGEPVAGSGLAGIVAQANAHADELLA
jgi:oxygen-dependent protoporphyrinogen oxidase